tara:strand:+ start:57 stop:326 length:270 start_codon:yes stop_codon:yes gene_type:complete
MDNNSYENPDNFTIQFSGLNDAFIGTVETFGRPPVACYSKQLTLEYLQKNFEISEKEARKRYEYEYLQTDMGDATPVFLDDEPITNVSE